MKRWSLIIILAVLTLVPIACGRANKGLIPVTFMLDWVPNTNHTGIFVTQAKGYFKEAGLVVEIIQPGEAYPEAAVASGAADFEGLRYGAWGSPFESPTLDVLMKCSDADFSKLKIVQTGFADPLALIEENQIDMAWIF